MFLEGSVYSTLTLACWRPFTSSSPGSWVIQGSAGMIKGHPVLPAVQIGLCWAFVGSSVGMTKWMSSRPAPSHRPSGGGGCTSWGFHSKEPSPTIHTISFLLWIQGQGQKHSAEDKMPSCVSCLGFTSGSLSLCRVPRPLSPHFAGLGDSSSPVTHQHSHSTVPRAHVTFFSFLCVYVLAHTCVYRGQRTMLSHYSSGTVHPVCVSYTSLASPSPASVLLLFWVRVSYVAQAGLELSM